MSNSKTTWVAVFNLLVFLILVLAAVFGKINEEQIESILTMMAPISISALGWLSQDAEGKNQ